MSFPKNSAFDDRVRVASLILDGFEADGPPITRPPDSAKIPYAQLEDWAYRLREALGGRTSAIHLDGLDQMADEVETYLRG